jgi:hypothetical protein
MGTIYKTRNNKTGEYSKKGSRFITKDYKSREEGCFVQVIPINSCLYEE